MITRYICFPLPISIRLAASLILMSSVAWSAQSAGDECQACDREMRRTMEAIQAWRRLHHGYYPGRLVDLKNAGLLPVDGAICPDVLHELNGATAAHAEVTSRGEGGDPPGTYEYEMATNVLKSSNERDFLPVGAREYTRQELKAILLRRAFFEQVPILRCSSHRRMAPAGFPRSEEVWRNATVTGSVYWSQTHWEQSWLDDVPYCERDANVLFGLKGPPFYTDKTPAIPEALDLRKWSCAFGDHVWWWTYPLFKPQPDWETAANLNPFFQTNHGRVESWGGEQWWINGLVQLQGRLILEGKDAYSGPTRLVFVWQKTGARVERKIHGASCLQGTVWPAPAGQTTGWLVWHYADGASEKMSIVYGKNTARFWGDAAQLQSEQDFVKPVWTYHENQTEAGRERWLRLYRQEWVNPNPEVVVTSLDFVSNSNSPASPFIIAVNTH